MFQEYKSRYGGNFPIPSESEIVSEFDKLAASIVAEQVTFNLGTYAYAKRTFGDYIDWWQAAINALCLYSRLLSYQDFDSDLGDKRKISRKVS